MSVSIEGLTKQLEILSEELSDKKTRIDVEGTGGGNDFFVIVNGSAEFYTELFKDSFISKQPIVLTSTTSGSKIIINPNNVFNVTIKGEIVTIEDEIEKVNCDE